MNKEFLAFLRKRKLLNFYIHMRVILSPLIMFKITGSMYSLYCISAGDLQRAGHLLRMNTRDKNVYEYWWVSLVNGKIQIGDELLLKRGDETQKVEVDFS